MNDVQEDYFAQQEEEIQRRYDPSIRLFFNPRIQRWLICQDLRIARKKGDPLIPRDVDLEGVAGIGEMTHFVALKKCEFLDGKPFPPLAELVIKILAVEGRLNGDVPATKTLKNYMEKNAERTRRFFQEKEDEVYEDLLPKALNRTTFFTRELKR